MQQQNLERRVVTTSIAVAAAAMLLTHAAPAAAQCQSSATSADVGVGSGTLALQAGTIQQNCSGRTTRVEAWMDGIPIDCPPETFDQFGNCLVQSTSGNAVVTIYSQIGYCYQGSWTGKSNHKYIENGTTTTIQANRATTLHGSTNCPQDCSQYGPGYYWNGTECTDVATPIIISTRPGAAYPLTSADEGVLFDLNADGAPEQVAWTREGSDLAFLALDRDGDGRITSGFELFGNNTVPGINNGFEALAHLAMESNGGERRGSVSSDDPLFSQLLLWTDSNHNGISEGPELRPASRVVSDVGLGYVRTERRDEFGNKFVYRGWVHMRTHPGRNSAASQEDNAARTRVIWDVALTRQQ